jgi:hypothetical protein
VRRGDFDGRPRGTMVTLDLSGKWTVRLCAGILGVGFSSR